MSYVQALEDWSGSRNAFRLVRIGWEGARWHAELTTTDRTPVPDLPITVGQAAGDEPILVSLALPFPERVAALTSASEDQELVIRDAVAAIDLARSGLVGCSVATDGAPRIELRAIVYGDGFTRHALNAAVLEIVKAYRILEQRLDELVVAALVSAASPEEGDAATVSRPVAEVRCTACGAANPPGSRFCNRCGAAVGSEAS